MLLCIVLRTTSRLMMHTRLCAAQTTCTNSKPLLSLMPLAAAKCRPCFQVFVLAQLNRESNRRKGKPACVCASPQFAVVIYLICNLTLVWNIEKKFYVYWVIGFICNCSCEVIICCRKSWTQFIHFHGLNNDWFNFSLKTILCCWTMSNILGTTETWCNEPRKCRILIFLNNSLNICVIYLCTPIYDTYIPWPP